MDGSAQRLWESSAALELDGKTPAAVRMILSSLDAAGPFAGINHRGGKRRPLRVKAALQLFSDPAGSAPTILYTRDVNPRGLGFITAKRLPLGYGGVVQLRPRADDPILRIDCTLHRCRQVAADWFEGALYFNREQLCFLVEEQRESGTRN